MRFTKQIFCVLVVLLYLMGCEEQSFQDDVPQGFHVAPSNLVYSSITEARENAGVQTMLPSVSSSGLPVYYELVSVKNGSGTVLDPSYLSKVSIGNPTMGTIAIDIEDSESSVQQYDKEYIDISEAGIVSVEDDNLFDIGDYYFTIDARTNVNGNTKTKRFEDVLFINFGPEKPVSIVYEPYVQNLVVNSQSKNKTSEPILTGPSPNLNVTYELASHTDKLKIDSETGAISLIEGYVYQTQDRITPKINLISSISGEVFVFDSLLFEIVISDTEVSLEKASFNFFYPDLSSNNKLYGVLWYLKNPSPFTQPSQEWKQWQRVDPAQPAAAERVVEGNKSLKFWNRYPTWTESSPVETVLIFTAQDLRPYDTGLDVTATYWVKYEALVQNNGVSPIQIRTYVSNESIRSDILEDGILEFAPLTDVSSLLKYQVNGTGDVFDGTPIPGANSGAWIKCTLDLEPYVNYDNFTLMLDYDSNFEGVISTATNTGFAGNTYISDVNYKAVEK